jgi:hypothetical protein
MEMGDFEETCSCYTSYHIENKTVGTNHCSQTGVKYLSTIHTAMQVTNILNQPHAHTTLHYTEEYLHTF